MRVVGIRELKNRLSQYVRAARDGETVLVTDRGRVVAELRPADERSGVELPAALAEMIREGALRPPLIAHGPHLYPPRKRLAPEGTALRLLNEDRGER